MISLSFIILILILVAVAGIAGIIIYRNIKRRSDKIPIPKYRIRLAVDLEHCSIGSIEQVEIKKVVSEITHQIHEGEWKGIYKSDPINLPETNVRKKLSAARKTFLYIDPVDKGHYYLDTTFLTSGN
jgi:hypothetical protein